MKEESTKNFRNQQPKETSQYSSEREPEKAGNWNPFRWLRDPFSRLHHFVCPKKPHSREPLHCLHLVLNLPKAVTVACGHHHSPSCRHSPLKMRQLRRPTLLSLLVAATTPKWYLNLGQGLDKEGYTFES